MDDGRDLNKASEDDLKAAKAAMEVDFERHALKPGDAQWVVCGRGVSQPSVSHGGYLHATQ